MHLYVPVIRISIFPLQNVSLDKMDAVTAATSRPLSSSRSRKSKPCLKNYSFYTGSGLEKGINKEHFIRCMYIITESYAVTASEMVNSNSPCRRTKTRPLIPIKEEYVSSKQVSQVSMNG